MTYYFSLSKANQEAIAKATEILEAVAESLSDEIGEHRSEWDDRDEDWQDSPSGQGIESWLIDLDALAEKVEDLATSFDEVETTPSS